MAEPVETALLLHQCNQCPARYARLDHLRRHKLTHEGQKCCTCEFCGAQFHRRDILRRHYRTCRLRDDQPIPQSYPRGRRKKACDRCAQNKLACDMRRPCQTCESKSLVCSWTRIQQASSAPSQPTRCQPQESVADPVVSSTVENLPLACEGEDVALPELEVLENQPSTSISQASNFALRNTQVPFLVNFVNSENIAFADIFGYSSKAPAILRPRAESVSSNQHSLDYSVEQTSPDHGAYDFTLPATGSGNALGGSFFDDMAMNREYMAGQGSFLNITSTEGISRDRLDSGPLPDPAKRQLGKIIVQLTDLYITLPKGHHARAPGVQIKDTDKFLTVSNLKLFIQTYFHHFYPHCPIIHRTTFNPKTTSLRLILAICLAGASYSSLQDVLTWEQSILDLAEEYVFRNPYLDGLSKGKFNSDANPDNYNAHLQAMQAALIIIFLQNWEGNEPARRRIRTQRFGTIVSSTRALRLTSLQNQCFIPELSPEFDWSAFVAQESCLRVMHYTLILDSGFCILHSYPPRLGLAEMTADMPCSEETFDASTSTECYQNAIQESTGRPQALVSMLKLLIAIDFEEETIASFVNLTTLHFFIIINALLIIIWTNRTNAFGQIPHDTLDEALSRWEMLWRLHRKGVKLQNFKRYGFMKNAYEYWWLAKLLLYTTTRELDQHSRCVLFEDDKMNYIRSLMKRYCAPGTFEDDNVELVPT